MPRGALRRDRLVVTAGLLTLAGLAWAYIAHSAALMPAHLGMAMPQARPRHVGERAGLAIMWIVMMIAMMISSVAPVMLLFASVSRRRRVHGVLATPVSVFTLGYLYAVLADLTRSALLSAALLSPAMASESPLLG